MKPVFPTQVAGWPVYRLLTPDDYYKSIAEILYNKIVVKLSRFFGVILAVCILLVSGTSSHVEAQRIGPYFADTGHSVSGEFWSYYQSIPNAAFVFGSPITEQFSDARTGRLIQYFQRVRFELYPEKPPGQRVVLSTLGPLVYEHTPPKSAINTYNPIACRVYSETGFSLCYAFLEFFDRNGGEAIFGKPVSASVFYNDRIVQYFEHARFDWYPEYPEGQKVVLAQLGRIYFDIVPEDSSRLRPVDGKNTQGNIKSIQARAFTWKAITRLNDQQVVYVVVQDQTLSPVMNASVVVKVTWATGETESFSQNTNANGVAVLPFQVQAQAHGSLVQIETNVLFQGLTSRNITSFRIWQ